jgi:hypothetical protein
MSTRFISFRGFRWDVVETPSLADTTQRRRASGARTALYFLSKFGTRRTDHFPSDWSKLSEKELRALCERAYTLAENAVLEPVIEL